MELIETRAKGGEVQLKVFRPKQTKEDKLASALEGAYTRVLNGLGANAAVQFTGGNTIDPTITIVATEARIRYDMLCVATSWTRFGVPDGLISPEAKAIDMELIAQMKQSAA